MNVKSTEVKLNPIRAPLQIIYQSTEKLKPNARNPRKHPRWQIKQIASSIRTFGFITAILVDGQGNVVAGHGRLEAAKFLGLTEIPTIQLDHLTPAQLTAYMVTDNRLTEVSRWDDELLAETFKELVAVELDFDIEVTGFNAAEIDLRIESLTLDEGKPDAADQLPDATGSVVSQVGDLFSLKDHLLLCGDASQPESYRRLLGDHKANLVATDPPFNCPIAGFVSGLGNTKHADFVMGAGEMSEKQFSSFLQTSLAACTQHATKGALLYAWIDWRSLRVLLDVLHSLNLELVNICVWGKNRAGMGSFYRSQHELCVCVKCGKGSFRNNIQLGRHGRHRSNLWLHDGMATERFRSEEGDLLKLHSTVKPAMLIQDIILDCTARGDLVLDPFMGSGTTIIAAQRSGRRCAGIELDPKYIDTAIRRWQTFTGEDAIHLESGKTFTQLAAMRRIV